MLYIRLKCQISTCLSGHSLLQSVPSPRCCCVQTVDVRVREQPDKSLLATFGGATHLIYGMEEPLGLRMVSNRTCLQTYHTVGCCTLVRRLWLSTYLLLYRGEAMPLMDLASASWRIVSLLLSHTCIQRSCMLALTCTHCELNAYVTLM